jgi:hypothetical protein
MVAVLCKSASESSISMQSVLEIILKDEHIIIKKLNHNEMIIRLTIMSVGVP